MFTTQSKDLVHFSCGNRAKDRDIHLPFTAYWSRDAPPTV